MSYTLQATEAENGECCFFTMQPDLLIWIAMLFGTSFLTYYLCKYALDYIESGRFKKDHLKQHVFIVRSQPSQNMEDDIVEYIKQHSNDRPYKIIWNRAYSSPDVQNVSERVFLRFMKKLVNTNNDLYVFAPNNHRSAYDNFIYFADIFKIKYKILDFVLTDSYEVSAERQLMNYENRERTEILI
jgi:hypothetical protein